MVTRMRDQQISLNLDLNLSAKTPQPKHEPMHSGTQSQTQPPAGADRWSSWMGRARTCFKVAGAIDATTSTLVATARELDSSTDDAARDAANALRLAEAALIRARAAVQMALDAKKLTPANREASYGLQ